MDDDLNTDDFCHFFIAVIHLFEKLWGKTVGRSVFDNEVLFAVGGDFVMDVRIGVFHVVHDQEGTVSIRFDLFGMQSSVFFDFKVVQVIFFYDIIRIFVLFFVRIESLLGIGSFHPLQTAGREFFFPEMIVAELTEG